jgi:O-methyltransferase involved in polyketide biosynthesis
VDVDLPDILRYKGEVLRDERPVCRYETRIADLRDAGVRTALFAELGRDAARVLVVTEGLLIYLGREEVAALARDLHAQPAFRWWLFDLASPRLLQRLAKSWGPAVAAADAPFRFGPAEGTAFFAPFGWRVAQGRSLMAEAHRLRREPPLMWLWRPLMRLASPARRDEVRRMSVIALLERA